MYTQYTKIEFPENYQFADLVDVFGSQVAKTGDNFVIVRMSCLQAKQYFCAHAGAQEDAADQTIQFREVLSLAA